MVRRLPKDHPAFAGHFPGQPLAPGVVVLDQVIQALRERLGVDVCVTRIPVAKFNQALLPDTAFHVSFNDLANDKATFKVCGDNGEQFASGQICFELHPSPLDAR